MPRIAKDPQKIDLVISRIEELGARIDALVSNPLMVGSPTIARELESMKVSLAELKKDSQRITAPVRLPPPQAMQVDLISTVNFQRLEEYRSEENKWFAVASLFGGTILGLLTNVLTGGKWTAQAWFFVAACVVMSTVSVWTALSSKRRADILKQAILNYEAPPQETG